MRSSTAQDFDAVYDIYMDDSVNPYMHHEVMDKEKFKPVFNDIQARDYSWVCERDGQVVGMCSAIKGDARTAHVARLSSLGIKKTQQGKGLGKEFVNDIINILKNDGISRIDLMAEADNEKALRFYKAIGFQVDGRMPKYFKRENSTEYIDEILMSKTF